MRDGLRVWNLWEANAQEVAVFQTQTGSQEESEDRGPLRGMRQDLHEWRETTKTYDKGASERETISMRFMRQVFQDRGILEDPSEAA